MHGACLLEMLWHYNIRHYIFPAINVLLVWEFHDLGNSALEQSDPDATAKKNNKLHYLPKKETPLHFGQKKISLQSPHPVNEIDRALPYL